MASCRQLFWLVDLTLDVYLFYIVFGVESRLSAHTNCTVCMCLVFYFAGSSIFNSFIYDFIAFKIPQWNVPCAYILCIVHTLCTVSIAVFFHKLHTQVPTLPFRIPEESIYVRAEFLQLLHQIFQYLQAFKPTKPNMTRHAMLCSFLFIFARKKWHCVIRCEYCTLPRRKVFSKMGK